VECRQRGSRHETEKSVSRLWAIPCTRNGPAADPVQAINWAEFPFETLGQPSFLGKRYSTSPAYRAIQRYFTAFADEAVAEVDLLIHLLKTTLQGDHSHGGHRGLVTSTTFPNERGNTASSRNLLSLIYRACACAWFMAAVLINWS
jgi:hypothetical protein